MEKKQTKPTAKKTIQKRGVAKKPTAKEQINKKASTKLASVNTQTTKPKVDPKEKVNTKIICTLGPACEKFDTMQKMFDAGMSVARINMSHGTYDTLQSLINTAKPLRRKGLELLIDTKGPEIRIGTFEKSEVELKKGQKFTLTTRGVPGNEHEVRLRYKILVNQVKPGDIILANNGQIKMKVVEVNSTDIVTKVLFGGKLSNNKSLNVPGVVPAAPYLSEQDKSDILFGMKNKPDYLALSFVSCAQDVIDVKKFLKAKKCDKVKIIAKIENGAGVKNASEILKECDGLMVARGDLGVEIPLEKLPMIQKKLISLCNVRRKFAIVATEMLESMTYALRPTRAEVTDVANAIYEEANATMLSGETSVGRDPVMVVETMSKIIREVEKVMYDTKIEF